MLLMYVVDKNSKRCNWFQESCSSPRLFLGWKKCFLFFLFLDVCL